MEKLIESLKKQFDNTYDNIIELKTFLLDPESNKKIDNLTKDLLIGQLKSMETYYSILSITLGMQNFIKTKNND